MNKQLVISDFLNRAEAIYGDRIAIIDEPNKNSSNFTSPTYREMAELARGQASWLDEIGVPVGGRVAVVSHNSARLLTSYFGISGWGRIMVPINFRLSPEEIEYIVKHSGAEVLLVEPELSPYLEHIDVPTYAVLGENDNLVFPLGRTPREWEPDELATVSINYTSGTTAKPKGVVLTHRSMSLAAAIQSNNHGIDENDVILHTLPLFHCNGWSIPYSITGNGAKHIILRKINGQDILRRVDEYGVTIMCGAPAVVNIILEAALRWEGPIPGNKKVRIVVAGAPPPVSMIERVKTVLGWEFIQTYGMTEMPILSVNRAPDDWKSLSSSELARRLSRAGLPVLGTDIKVDDTGEILVRSNTEFISYWNQPDENLHSREEGWFRTGDGGFIDNDGYLNITDRKKDMIISGGENISPMEIESVLLDHPHIKEVAVVGLPDGKWGEAVMALIVVCGEEDITPEEVQTFARKHLAGYKVPRHIKFCDTLPRTATGKLKKAKIREVYCKLSQ